MSRNAFGDLFAPHALTEETEAFSSAQRDKSNTRWQGLNDDQRRQEMAPALLGRQRKAARRKAVQAAVDDLSARTFTIAMDAVSGLRAEDGRLRQAALDTAAARFIVAVHDLAAALSAIDAEDGAA